jgi:hypothetical protein
MTFIYWVKSLRVTLAVVLREPQEAPETDLFLMEAMWTYFFPAMAKVRELVFDLLGNGFGYEAAEV